MNDDRFADHRYPAPAKLNLFLHVVGRRADGYHLIQSAMQLIDLADTVSIESRDDGVVTRAVALPGIDEADDLTIRAARLLRSASGTRHGATIAVDKRIPQGGGLGGGSSDAATTLLALNRLWHLHWPRTRLMELGLSLGADVPFFLGGGSAFVEGIGEKLSPVALPDVDYVVVHPGVAVPTVAIFTASELTRNTRPIKLLDFSTFVDAAFAAGKTGADPGTIEWRNDLEPVAAARFPAVGAALDWLSRQDAGDVVAGSGGERVGAARMSGSGACVFRPFAGRTRVVDALKALPAGWSGWHARSLPVHPLAGFADD